MTDDFFRHFSVLAGIVGILFFQALGLSSIWMEYEAGEGALLTSISGRMGLFGMALVAVLVLLRISRTLTRGVPWAWIGYGLLSWFLLWHAIAIAQHVDFARTQTLFLLGAFGIGLAASEGRADSVLARFFTWGGASVMLVVLVIPVAYVLAPELLTSEQWTRALPGFGNVRVFGEHAMASGLILTGVLLTARSHLARGAGAFGMAAMTLVVFWTGYRGGFLVMVVIVGLGIWLAARTLKDHAGQFRANTMALIAAIAVGILGYVAMDTPSNAFDLLWRFERSAEMASEGGDITSRRAVIWGATLEHALERPALGWGYLHLDLTEDPRIHTANAHNFAIDAVFGWGFPAGVLVVLLLVGTWVRGLIRALRTRSPELVMPVVTGTGLGLLALMDPVMTAGFPRAILLFALGATLSWGGKRNRLHLD